MISGVAEETGWHVIPAATDFNLFNISNIISCTYQSRNRGHIILASAVVRSLVSHSPLDVIASLTIGIIGTSWICRTVCLHLYSVSLSCLVQSCSLLRSAADHLPLVTSLQICKVHIHVWYQLSGWIMSTAACWGPSEFKFPFCSLPQKLDI